MIFKQTRGIVLASSSPRRKAFLERYDLEFRILTGALDEKVNEGEQPIEYAARTAREKAECILDQCTKEEIVISADTIVIFENKILGKPRSSSDSFEMIKQLNGNTHEVITSYFVYNCENAGVIQRNTSTKVSFIRQPENLLKSYADSNEPLDKAGAYSIQGVGTFLVKSIIGSYNNVVGLPIELLLKDLIENRYLLIANSTNKFFG